MSRQPEYKRAGYLLPENIDPEDCICVCVPIPNDERHIQAFKAQLFALSRWWTWERDDLKRGKDAAAVWAGIYECVEARMDNNCGCGGGESLPLQYRYTPSGQLEVSTDGGATWQDGSAYDTRNQVPVYPPAATLPDDSECLYAENITDKVKELVEITINQLESGGTVASAAGAILPILVTLGLVAAPAAVFMILLYGIASTVISLIAGGVSNSFDTAFWGEFKCMWYCVINPDGEVTEAMIDIVKQNVDDYFGPSNPLATKTIQDTIGMMGANMLTNAARMGDSILNSDCEGCDCENIWCYTFNFVISDGDWERQPSASVLFGTYEAGTGWAYSDETNIQTGITTAHRQVIIGRDFSSATLTRILVTFDYTGGTFDNAALTAFALALDGTNVITVNRAAMVNGDGQTREWTSSGTDIEEITLNLRSSRDVTSPYSYSGNAVIRSVRIEGRGTNPFGDDNCE